MERLMRDLNGGKSPLPVWPSNLSVVGSTFGCRSNALLSTRSPGVYFLNTRSCNRCLCGPFLAQPFARFRWQRDEVPLGAALVARHTRVITFTFLTTVQAMLTLSKVLQRPKFVQHMNTLWKLWPWDLMNSCHVCLRKSLVVSEPSGADSYSQDQTIEK